MLLTVPHWHVGRSQPASYGRQLGACVFAVWQQCFWNSALCSMSRSFGYLRATADRVRYCDWVGWKAPSKHEHSLTLTQSYGSSSALLDRIEAFHISTGRCLLAFLLLPSYLSLFIWPLIESPFGGAGLNGMHSYLGLCSMFGNSAAGKHCLPSMDWSHETAMTEEKTEIFNPS